MPTYYLSKDKCFCCGRYKITTRLCNIYPGQKALLAGRREDGKKYQSFLEFLEVVFDPKVTIHDHDGNEITANVLVDNIIAAQFDDECESPYEFVKDNTPPPWIDSHGYVFEDRK